MNGSLIRQNEKQLMVSEKLYQDRNFINSALRRSAIAAYTYIYVNTYCEIKINVR